MSSSSALSAYAMTKDPQLHSEILARHLGADEEAVKDPKRRVHFLQSCKDADVHANFHTAITEEVCVNKTY